MEENSSSYQNIEAIINRRHQESHSTSLGSNIITEKKKILIVDAEMDIANLYKLSLERDGFFVEIFNDPLSALSRYKAGCQVVSGNSITLEIKSDR